MDFLCMSMDRLLLTPIYEYLDAITKTYWCSLVTLPHCWSLSPMLLRHKLMVLQANSLVDLPLEWIECLCALCANDTMVRTSLLRQSLLTQIRSHHCWHKVKAITLMQTSSSAILFYFFICHLYLPCFGLTSLNLIYNYHVCDCHCLISFDFYVCVFYRKVIHQWQWWWPSYPQGTYFSFENTKLFLYYRCCLLPLPYSLGFTLFLVFHSLSWPYSLNLYFTLFLFYPPNLHFIPLVLTLLPRPLLQFIMILPPYLHFIPLVLTLIPRPLLQFIIILSPYLYHTPCIFTPLLLDLHIVSLCFLNLSSLIGHQNSSQTFLHLQYLSGRL